MTNHTPTSHAAQAGIDLDIDLDQLETQARAAYEADEPHISFVSPYDLLALISLARNAACAAQDARQGINPVADERVLFEAYYQSRAKPMSYPNEYFSLVEKTVDGGNTVMVYEHDWMQKHWEIWSARAALAQQSAMCQPPAPVCQAADAICQPAAQAVDARALDARYREGYGDGWNEGRADLAASPAPETAQAERTWWVTGDKAGCANCGSALVDHIYQRYCPEAHAQQDEAPAEGYLLRNPITGKEGWMSVSEFERMRDHYETAGFGIVELVRRHVPQQGVPSAATEPCIEAECVSESKTWQNRPASFAATGKAAAANAGGLDDDALYNAIINLHPELHRHIEYKRGHDAACIEAANLVLNRISATSAADAKDAERWRFIVKDGKSISGRFTLVRADDSGRVDELHGGEYNRVIDAAIAASQKGTEA